MSDCETPVLLSLTLIAAILHRPIQSVHRWHSVGATSGSRMPTADVMVGSTPLWFEATFLDYADHRKLPVDYALLESIRQRQSVG